MKVKEFNSIYDGVILFSLKGKIIGDNGLYGIFGLDHDVNEYEIESISSFYERTGPYKHGVIVVLKEGEE